MAIRVTQHQLTQKMLTSMRERMAEQSKYNDQILQETRIFKPSDDPLGTSKLLGVDNKQRRLDEYKSTVTQAKSWMESTHQELDKTSGIWKRISELAKQANNGVRNQDDQETISRELDQLIQDLVEAANGKHNGEYVFGGSQTRSAAFQAEMSSDGQQITGVFYQGDSRVREVKTAESGRLKTSILGSNSSNPNQKGVFIDSNEDINLFSTAIELRNRTQSNNLIGAGEIGGIIDKIDAAAKNITSTQSRLGASIQSLELDRKAIQQQNADIDIYRRDITSIDRAELLIKLTEINNSYQAALASSVRLMQQGLLKFI
ncbi:MAG: flagellar hook-associated protein FlgL [Chlamydiia bacterium]|nr:flagellar hook-associated protein FlgL [Chlamydiia bacterium]